MRNSNLIQVKKKKKVRWKPKITLLEVVKNDILINEVTNSDFGYDRIIEKNTCGWP